MPLDAITLDHLTDVQKAHLAGYLDGEGTFGLYADKGAYQAFCKVETAAGQYLRQIGHAYGVKVCRCSKSERHHKQTYAIKFMGKALYQLLHDVLPYLQEKRPQAVQLLRYLSFRKGRGKGKRMSVFDASVAKRMSDRLKLLKTL